MAVGTGKAADIDEARKLLLEKLNDGSALRKFAEFVEAQGGDSAPVYNTALLPQASIVKEIYAPMDGYVSHIESDRVGISAMKLGGGRETKESSIDLSVGILIRRKVGDAVKKGEPVAALYANDNDKLSAAISELEQSYSYSAEPVERPKLIKTIIK